MTNFDQQASLGGKSCFQPTGYTANEVGSEQLKRSSAVQFDVILKNQTKRY